MCARFGFTKLTFIPIYPYTRTHTHTHTQPSLPDSRHKGGLSQEVSNSCSTLFALMDALHGHLCPTVHPRVYLPKLSLAKQLTRLNVRPWQTPFWIKENLSQVKCCKGMVHCIIRQKDNRAQNMLAYVHSNVNALLRVWSNMCAPVHCQVLH